MFKRTIAVCAALVFTGVVLAQAYRWTDEDGIVHYTDRPVPGAERIDLPTYHPPSESGTPAPASAPRTGARDDEPVPVFSYESLSIVSPAAEETLWNIEGVLNVQLDLRPRLQRGHQLRLYFDGEPRNVSGISFQIPEVYRGVHNLQAEVVDQDGKLLIRSQPNRFYVQQNTITRRPAN